MGSKVNRERESISEAWVQKFFKKRKASMKHVFKSSLRKGKHQ
jgi:hypothetical protein